MSLLCFFLLFGWNAVAAAEHLNEPNQVYSRSSQLSVQNINNAVEVLRDPNKVIAEKTTEFFGEKPSDAQNITQPVRDPTQMSGSFRQALRSYAPRTPSTNDAGTQVIVPTITLAGKVYVPPSLNNLKRDERSSVALSIDDTIVHLKEGDTSSIIKKEHLITIIVEHISEHAVQIKLQPSNETLILH